MDRDGAEGLKELCANTAFTPSAQDQATGRVYSLPKTVVKLQAADEILALDKIAPRLTNMFSQTIKT